MLLPLQIIHVKHRPFGAHAAKIRCGFAVVTPRRNTGQTRAHATSHIAFQRDLARYAPLGCHLGNRTQHGLRPAGKNRGGTPLELIQLLRQLGTAASSQASSAPHNAAYPALQQMHRHPEEEVTMQTLAELCGMSPTRFSRHFKALTGVTPGTYRLNLRLNGARQLLAQGESLACAAQHMGFADQAHMQRAFKAHHAMTPGNYAHNCS